MPWHITEAVFFLVYSFDDQQCEVARTCTAVGGNCSSVICFSLEAAATRRDPFTVGAGHVLQPGGVWRASRNTTRVISMLSWLRIKGLQLIEWNEAVRALVGYEN